MGMMTCPLRSQAEKRMFGLLWPNSSERGWPTMESVSRTRTPSISTLPRKKVSTLAAAGKRSRREISKAVEYSGLMTESMLRSFWREARSSV